MPAKTDPRDGNTSPAATPYYYRRRLSPRELLPAIGAGVAAGIFVFYLVQLRDQRTPLTPEALEPATRRHRPKRDRGG
jgi:hypothetical protein